MQLQKDDSALDGKIIALVDYEPIFLPDETPQDFYTLRDDLTKHLNPVGLHQHLTSKHLVLLYWTRDRIRRVTEKQVKYKIRDLALQELVVRFIDIALTGSENVGIATNLSSPDQVLRAEAIDFFTGNGVDIDAVTANAYEALAQRLAGSERDISDLEARIRRQHSDYEALKVKSAKIIPDAEIIEAA